MSVWSDSTQARNSTQTLICFPWQGIDKSNYLSCDLTLDFERSIFTLTITVSDSNQLLSYYTDTIALANNNYICLPMDHAYEIVCNHVCIKKKKGEMMDSSNSPWTALLSPKPWSPDLAQRIILLRCAWLTKGVMLVKPFIVTYMIFFSNLAKADSLEHHVVSYLQGYLHVVELCVAGCFYSWVKWGPSSNYLVRTLPRFLITFSMNTKWVPICIVPVIINKVAIDSML